MFSERLVDDLTAFVVDVEPKLRLAFCANFRIELRVEATADALALLGSTGVG